MCAVFQLSAFPCQAPPGARSHTGQRRAISAFQSQLVLDASFGEDACSAFWSHDFEAGLQGSPHADAYAVDPLLLHQGLRSKLKIVQAKGPWSDDEIFADQASSAHDAETDSKLAMLVEQRAGFKLLASSDQDDRNSSVKSVCSDKIPRICRNVVLLTIMLA